jgi:hypothetical protein
MQIAIFYNDGSIFVKFNKDKFIKLLTEYIQKYRSVEKAIEKIETELKKKTISK